MVWCEKSENPQEGALKKFLCSREELQGYVFLYSSDTASFQIDAAF